MPKPPMDPQNFDKVNYVIDAWTTGCDAPWYIYIETMKPALLAAFITLITFGWDDVLRGFFRPRGLYARRTGKRKGKWARRIPRFPELGEMIGKELPGADEVKGTKWNNLGKTLWRVDGALQQIAFWWLVAEVTEDFAFNWTSVLFESYWCLPDAPGRFSYRLDAMHVLIGNDWHRVGFPWEDYEEGPPFWGFWTGNSGPNGCTATAALNFEVLPAFPGAANFKTRIIETGGGPVYALSEQEIGDMSTEVSMPASGSIPPNTTFQVEVWTDLTFALHGEGVVIGIEDQ